MPVIHVATWPVRDESVIEGLVTDITRSVHSHTGAPLDKISVYVTEVSPGRWGEAGVLGSDPAFADRSRRQCYENDHER